MVVAYSSRQLTRGVAWLNSPVRRALDVLVAALGMLVLSGPYVAIAGLVRATSAGPAIYASPRIGLHGRQFKMLKFRSMLDNADQRGSLVTGADDPRVTPVGRWLRRTKLDELPSLWNVLVGDMALVGPRPENPRSVMTYTPQQRTVFGVRPGLTSLASIKYRNEEDLLGGPDGLEERYRTIMADKLRLDLDYLERASPTEDLRVLVLTMGALVGVEYA